MKKIISLFITFLFFFGLFSDVFAMKTNSVDIDDFSTFSIEQVQNAFSNSLSEQQSSDNKTENQADDVFSFADTDYSIPTFFVMNFIQPTTNFYFCDIDLYGLNYFYRNKIFDETKLFGGLSEYKITQNSYMAVALFDVVNSVYMIM
jgi:hypothetical protein